MLSSLAVPVRVMPLPVAWVLASVPSSVVFVALRLPSALSVRVNWPSPLMGVPPKTRGELLPVSTNTVAGRLSVGKAGAKAIRLTVPATWAVLSCCWVKLRL